MPQPNTPLSYDALRHFLQYLDPNKRASLVRRCPSLKAPDNKLPQKISAFRLEPSSITINNITYRMGVVMKYPKGAVIPVRIMEINRNGGVPWDVDRFGFKIPSANGAPGQPTEEQIRNFCQRHISELREELDWLKHKKKCIEASIEKNRDVESKRLRKEAILKETDEAIAEVEADILLYQLRIDNNERDIPFTLLLQLTISINGSVLAVQRMKYTRSIGQAMKYLIGRLLRNTESFVNSLRIDPCDYRDRFWIPTELKLTARHLIVERLDESVMRTVREFFRRINRRPFEFIGYESRGVLIIKEMDPSLQIHTIRYSRLHFDFCLVYTNFRPLIDHWVRNGAPIGTWYTAYTTPWQGSDWYDDMKRREGHTVVEKATRWCPSSLHECVILPLPNNTQLEFYIVPIVNYPFPLMLNFEIQPRPV